MVMTEIVDPPVSQQILAFPGFLQNVCTSNYPHYLHLSLLLISPVIGMPYLDVIRRLRDASNLPIAAYQVSGEYAMLKAAAQKVRPYHLLSHLIKWFNISFLAITCLFLL